MQREKLNKLMIMKAKEKKLKSHHVTISCTVITIVC